MSRIHDALRRAEQEKGTPASPAASSGAPAPAPQQAPPAEPEPAPVRESDSAKAPAPEKPAQPEKPAASGSAAAIAAASAATPPSSSAVAPAHGLTIVPRAPTPALLDSCRRPLWLGDPAKLLFLGSSGRTPATEQLRNLRSRLSELRSRRALKIVMISSPLASEGKTFLAANLAHAFARQHDRRILLVDADLHRPALHSILGAPADPGLSDYLRGKAAEDQILQRGPQENLFFIPAGTHAPDPASLLSTGKLKTLLSRLAPLFDWILLDAPPIADAAGKKPLSAEASVLANSCDGIVMVIHAGATPRAAAQSAARAVPRERLLGVVLNHASV